MYHEQEVAFNKVAAANLHQWKKCDWAYSKVSPNVMYHEQVVAFNKVAAANLHQWKKCDWAYNKPILSGHSKEDQKIGFGDR